MRLKPSHAARSGVGEHTARESESAQCVRLGRERGELPPPSLAPEPKGSGAFLFLGAEACRAKHGRLLRADSFFSWNVRFPAAGAQACPFDGFNRLTASRLRMTLGGVGWVRAPEHVEGLRPSPRARPAFAKATARQARPHPCGGGGATLLASRAPRHGGVAENESGLGSCGRISRLATASGARSCGTGILPVDARQATWARPGLRRRLRRAGSPMPLAPPSIGRCARLLAQRTPALHSCRPGRTVIPFFAGPGMNHNIRNIAIIAHVDHGKTTLVDELLKEGGVYRANQQVEECVMDSMELEREKGITIKAKNASIHWRGKTINLVDTPGHADFGGEVERSLKMVDGVLLLVDAYDGPQAQTRFVLRKALQHGLKVIIVVNKTDRENSDPAGTYNKVLELLLELEANEEQFNAPVVYGSGRDGYMVRKPGEKAGDMTALFETILDHIPPPFAKPDDPFRMLVSNIDWDDYVGRIAIGKVLSGQITVGDTVYVLHPKGGNPARCKITKVVEFSGTQTSESAAGVAGNIVGLSGFEDIDIGDTIAADENAHALPFTEIDPPTIEMQFCINDGPLAGRDGKYVTSRQLRDRLFREMKSNISIKVSRH